MAAATDKARFYLEQYVPELQEYERKEIFSREEIRSITSKRSDFEHTLNARGSKPSDYARYATYEMNLDSLRKKRCKRLGVKSTNFSGQRTVFFILDRGTKKFPGDLALWMQYIQLCQREKANKKLAKVFTNVLRLKPREWGLWILAAKHYSETQGDMSTARSYLQRGLRFCKDEKKLWLEYARLELVYLAKLVARRKILRLDELKDDPRTEQEPEDEDMLRLPEITTEDLDTDANKGVEEVDAKVLQKLGSTPVFEGAIPIAIFDSAMKQFEGDPEIAEEFFDLLSSFDQVPCARKILGHILDHLQVTASDSAEAVICEAKMALYGIEAQSVEFPEALGSSLAIVKKGLSGVGHKSEPKLAEKMLLVLLPYLDAEKDLDEDVETVLEASARRYLRLVPEEAVARLEGVKQDTLNRVLGSLLGSGSGSNVDKPPGLSNAMVLG